MPSMGVWTLETGLGSRGSDALALTLTLTIGLREAQTADADGAAGEADERTVGTINSRGRQCLQALENKMWMVRVRLKLNDGQGELDGDGGCAWSVVAVAVAVAASWPGCSQHWQ